MKKRTHFGVSPRLAALLSEGYRSSEKALKELVDNAWDADAATVKVSLPQPLTDDPIVIDDDGSGMTPEEVQSIYLAIADGRRNRQGERTEGKKRLVKGRKGIGKFAGLLVATEMVLETHARGKLTRLRLRLADLEKALAARNDLESIPLDLTVEETDPNKHGSRVTLTSLNQRLHHPSPEKFGAILVREYGREPDFDIILNERRVGVQDVPGETHEISFEIPGVGPVRGVFTVADDSVRQPGLAVRVGGKVIGDPDLLGLDVDDLIPAKLGKRVFGEIEVDGLARDVTADFGGFLENSKGYQELRETVGKVVRDKVGDRFKTDVNLAKARQEKANKQRLEGLPEHRRGAAERAIEKLLQKFYGEQEDRIAVIVSLTLDAFETDDYWTVMQSLEAAGSSDVAAIAAALVDFGLVDMAVTARQARHRLEILDELETLVANAATREAQVHDVVEKNPWILGSHFSLLRSNETLQRSLGSAVPTERSKKRPDMLLAELRDRTHVLIEFKRPSHSITRDDEAQAMKYRDDLSSKFSAIKVLMVGKGRAINSNSMYPVDQLQVLSWDGIVASAKNEVAWLLETLSKP